MGVEHIIRINNKGAKAGNINNCLRNHSRSLYFSVLDADMIPKPTFLEQMMGYFKDKNIGFVQSPQVFYNADPYQFNLELNVYNDQDFFMREVQVGRDKYNAIVQIGTNAVFLRKAIDDIGGIPEDSITEDCATGMLVQAKGYKTIFVNEVLAVGLSPEHFRDLSKQRKRWSRGNIQVSKKHNPLTIKGLNIKQRLIYISGILFWYNSVFKMCFILTPIIYLLSGILIIDTDLISVTQFFIPSYLSYMLMFKSHNSKYTTLFRTHINETSLTCALFIPILMELVLSKELKFNVTNKGILAKNTFVSWNLLIPNFILFVLTILGFGVSANKFFINNSLELRGAILINIAWAVYNLIAIVATMMLCIEKPRKEELERKVINYRTTINETTHCVINNLSDSDFNIGINDLSCNLQLDDVFKISINNINVFSKIVDCHDNTFECRFIKLTKNQYLHILKFIYNDKSQGYYEEKNNSVIMQYNSFVTFMDSNELFAETEELKENCNIQVRTNEDLIIESKENTKKILSPMDMEMEDFLTQLDLDKKDIMLIKMYNELKNLKRNEKEVIQNLQQIENQWNLLKNKQYFQSEVNILVSMQKVSTTTGQVHERKFN
eukprot:TRINITY_DN4875_c0_g1_i1.p1 TRINITY_DN4875_c0_g1~~TRINITY_DN4875_c0_g1_i1.p1  ORF type:complete len:608 (-),score=51.25 TRINITY_DN4875_c0_g1_i1:74-1897(-)